MKARALATEMSFKRACTPAKRWKSPSRSVNQEGRANRILWTWSFLFFATIDPNQRKQRPALIK
jgi:hypothetical protein